MFGQGQGDRVAEAVEHEAVGDRMQQAAAERAEAGKGLQCIAGDGEHDRTRVAHAEAESREQRLDIELTHRHVVDAGEFAHERGAERALDQDVAARRHRGQRANHRAARVARHGRLRFAFGDIAREFAGALVHAREHGGLACRFERFGTRGGQLHQCRAHAVDLGRALALDAFATAVGQAALEALEPTGGGSDDRVHRVAVAFAEALQQGIALARVVLVDLVEHEHERLSETGQPVDLGGLRAREIGGGDVEDGVRAQCLVARELFAPAAVDLTAARHVGDHEHAPVGQFAAEMVDLARGAADHVDVDRGGRGECAHQARLAGADLAEHGDMAIAFTAPAIEFGEFVLEAFRLGAARAQVGDARLHLGPVRQARRVASRMSPGCRPEQLPGQHADGRQRGRGHDQQRQARVPRQGRQAFGQLEHSVDGADRQADERGDADGKDGEQDEAQRQSVGGHAPDSTGRQPRLRHRAMRGLSRRGRMGARRKGVLIMGRMLVVLLSLACVAVAHAAPPPAPPQFHVLRSRDGLPSNMPQAIRQDHDGFIWIATRHGLARYDGIRFRHWLHDPRDPASLTDNDITSLLVDRRGRLWCGTEGGGASVMQADGRFRHFRHVPGDAHSLGSDDVLALAEDSAGAIWVGTYLGGLARIDADGRVERIEHSLENAHGLRSNFVLGLFGDSRGRLWVGTDQGLDVRMPDGRFVAVGLPRMGVAGPEPRMIGAFWPEADGSMLVGLRGGVVRVRDDLGVDGVVGAAVNASVMALVRDHEGRLWAATTQGLLRAVGDRWEAFAAGEQERGEVPGTRAFDAMRDREGNLWFAFADGGVARLPPHADRFGVWQGGRSDSGSLTHTRLAGVAADPRGGAWVISDTDGLDHVGRDGTVTRHGARVSAGTALRAVAATDGHAWIGRWRGVLRYDPRRGRVDELPVGRTTHALPEAPVVLLRVAPDGALWAVARSGGVSRIDPHSLGVRTWAPEFGTLGHADIVALDFDGDGRPWTAGSRGFERFDPATDRFVPVGGPMSPTIEAFAFAADGSVWLHRLGALERHRVAASGLERIDTIDVDDGWPSMEARDLHVDADGNVWVSGFRGLWRVTPSTRRLRQYGDSDGLPSNEFVGGPLAAAADGIVFAATLGGLVAFDPQALVEHLPAPDLRITSVSVRRDGRRVELDPRQPELVLRHDDRDLQVGARALSFIAPGSHRFAFRVQPYETDWGDAAANGERLFPQLPAGLHALSARVSNADGNVRELEVPIVVRVTAAPWRHPLAWLSYALLAILLAGLALRQQRRRVEQRHALVLADEQRRQAERLGASKSAFLATMSHEIRTPMTSLLGMTELLQHTALDGRQQGYVEAIANSGELLLRLVNDSLDLARIEAGKLALEPRAFDPVALVDDVAALTRPLAMRRGLALRVARAEDVPRSVFGDPLRIEQVLLNLVGNAVKFTEQGGVDVGIARAGDGLLAFAVADSGPGMSADFLERLFGRFEQSAGTSRRHGGSGLGLAIARELVDLMGGRIAVDSLPGRGSRFVVELPLAETAPSPAAESRPDAGALPAHGLDVLVVEDDATVAGVLVGLLGLLGHRARVAADGLAALAELEHASADVVLVDFDLPGIDGLALARLLRQRERHLRRRLALVGISARAVGNEAEQARAAGMDAFVRKPVTAAMLGNALSPWAPDCA